MTVVASHSAGGPAQRPSPQSRRVLIGVLGAGLLGTVLWCAKCNTPRTQVSHTLVGSGHHVRWPSWASLRTSKTAPMAATAASEATDSFGIGLNDVAPGQPASDRDRKVLDWRSRIDKSIARSRAVKGGNYVQLATVTADLQPRVRTVVFRGFFTHPTTKAVALKIVTDSRSRKIPELVHNPKAEMVWWFFTTSEQYRVAGRVEIVGDNYADPLLAQTRRAQWTSLTDGAREQFYWLGQNTPGRKTTPPIPSGGRSDKGEILEPPETFILVLLWPSEVDYLRLKDNYRQLDQRSPSGDWAITPVFP